MSEDARWAVVAATSVLSLAMALWAASQGHAVLAVSGLLAYYGMLLWGVARG